MPAWKEYKKTAEQRGALAFELYVVVSTPCGSEEAVKSYLGDHLDYQAEQELQGRLAFAGPLSDESGEIMDGTGMIIYRTDSLEAARAIANSDPMHSSGARSFTIRRWLINEGSLSLNVKLSKQQVLLS